MESTLTRRRMLFMSAAGAAGLGLFDALKLRAEPVPGPQRDYGWFPMGVQSYTLRNYSAEEALDHLVKLGVHHVEFFGSHFPIDPDPSKVAPMLKATRRREISMSAHGVNNFSADHESNRRTFEFANLAGIRNLSADPDPDSFDSLERLVAEFGIRIAIHNHGPGHRYGSIEQCKKAIEGRHPGIGMCADLGHFIRSAEDPIEAIRAFEGRLYGIHLKDFAEQKRRAKGVILGKGHLDVEGVFRALREVNFPADGALSLEYEENPDNPLDDVRECLSVASEAAQRAVRG